MRRSHRRGAAKTGMAFILAFVLCFTLTPAFANPEPGENTAVQETESTEGTETPTPDETELPDAGGTHDPNGDDTQEADEGDVGEDEGDDKGEEGSELDDTESSEETEAFAGELDILASRAIADGTYFIRPASSLTRMLDVEGGSTANRANIQLWRSNKSAAQQFRVVFDSKSGYYTISIVGSGSLVDVSGGSGYAGANIHQYAANGSKAQKWQFVEDTSRPGSFILVSALSSTKPGERKLVADVAGGADAHGANIQLWSANASAAQSFYFLSTTYAHPSTRSVADGIYTIASGLNNNFVIDVPGGVSTLSTQLNLYRANASFAQSFKFTWDGAYYTITNVGSGCVFDGRDAGVVPFTALQQYRSNGSQAQRWAIEYNADGTYSFKAANSGLAIDASGGVAANYTQLHLYRPNGTSAQKFNLYLQAEATTQSMFNYDMVSFTPKTLSGSRIDVAGASLTSGSNVHAYRNNLSAAQMFVPQFVSGSSTKNYEGIYSFAAVHSLFYLTDSGGNVVQASGQSNAPRENQKWKVVLTVGGYALQNCGTGRYMALSGTDIITKASSVSFSPLDASISVAAGADDTMFFNITQARFIPSGYQKITAASGLVLDVSSGSYGNGLNIQLYKGNNSEGQIWLFELESTGYLSIRSAGWRRVLDIAGGNPTEGTNVNQYTYNASKAQQWKLVPAGSNCYYIANCDNWYLTSEGLHSGSNISVTAQKSKATVFSFSTTSYPRGNQVDKIMNAAYSQVGNVGGQPYWSWYGFTYRVEWCACYVSWCANQAGFLGNKIPKFALCQDGVNWYKSRLRWQSQLYMPQRGDIVFIDYEGDGWSDHVAIVEYCDGKTLYTIEGNRGDRCIKGSWSLSSGYIMGYGLPAYV